jgi:hypothetical protein
MTNTTKTEEQILDTLFDDAAFNDEGDLITTGAIDTDQAFFDMEANPTTMEQQLALCVAVDASQLNADTLFADMV